MRAATAPAVLTLPELSIVTGVHLDRLRRAVRNNPELRSLTSMVGPARVVRAGDVERVKELLDRSRG